MQRDPDFPDDAQLYDIREQLTALWQLPYSQQLSHKAATVAAMLHSLSWDMARRLGDTARPPWLLKALKQDDSWQPGCPLEVRLLRTLPASRVD